jgi:hypothetical protein
MKIEKISRLAELVDGDVVLLLENDPNGHPDESDPAGYTASVVVVVDVLPERKAAAMVPHTEDPVNVTWFRGNQGGEPFQIYEKSNHAFTSAGDFHSAELWLIHRKKN